MTDMQTISAGTKTLKHVVAISGSPRKGMTNKLLEDISDALAPYHVEVTIVRLQGYEIRDCVGCEACIRKTSQCIQQDDAQAILSQLLQADGIILASPVYMMSVTGKLKSLIDKTASWVHRPPLVGKPVLLVATTAGSGLGGVLKYLDQVTIEWGAFPTGRIGRTASSSGSISNKAIEQFVWHLWAEKDQYAPTFRQLIWYQVQKVLALKVLALDRAYWVERGWDKQPYYFPCRISPLKRLVAWSAYRILYWRVRPTVGL